MSKKLVFTMILLAGFLNNGFAYAKSLVIIGWDGAGYNNVIPLLEQGKLPNLQFLVKGGTFSKYEPVAKTETVPQWTAMFTGLCPSQTEIYANNSPNSFTVLPFKATIVKRLKEEKNLKIGWFVSKDNFSFNPRPLDSIRMHADQALGIFPRRTPEYGSGIVIGNKYIYRLTDEAVKFILFCKFEKQDYLVFLHLDPDIYGHAFGETGQRYLEEFMRSDEALGNVLNAIDRRDTKILVVSDHGFDKGGFFHKRAPDCWFATDLPIKSIYKLHPIGVSVEQESKGTTKDIALTIWDYFEIYDWRDNPVRYRGKTLLR